MTVLSKAVRAAARCRRLVRQAERRRCAARSERDLFLVEYLLRRALHQRCGAASVRRRALERLALLLCQQPERQDRARELLRRGSFQFQLSSGVLCYPLGDPPPAMRHPAPPSYLLSVADDALPAGMLAQLQRALAPSSPFWRAHGYRCGVSPFFSYVHHLDAPPRNAFDRVLAVLHAHVSRRFPLAAAATRAEWWAHCRPHGAGHQLHFDSDDEGRRGVRNPLVSSALYLTSDIGGPTLVTDQAVHSARLARRGWATLPHTNRLLMFNGKYLHGVVPGRGCVPRGDPTRRRITMMVAFWPAIRERESAEPVAARPFPYGDAEGWPSVFDWPEARDRAAPARAAKGAAAAAAGGEAPQVWCVEPVWQPVDAEEPTPAQGSMPAYEACFQGF